MTEEIHKICLMCSRLYEGDPKTYTGENVSHGLCQDKDCQAAYIMLSFGCSKKEAESMLEEMAKETD